MLFFIPSMWLFVTAGGHIFFKRLKAARQKTVRKRSAEFEKYFFRF